MLDTKEEMNDSESPGPVDYRMASSFADTKDSVPAEDPYIASKLVDFTLTP